MNDLILKIKRLNKNATIPSKSTSGSAGYDLTACIDEPIVIPRGAIKVIPLGIATEVSSNDVAMFIYPRSGLSTKNGITLANSVGLIDADYRGEWKVSLINNGNESFEVTNGMRIAQLVVMNVLSPSIVEVDELNNTERGTGGFGSTGME